MFDLINVVIKRSLPHIVHSQGFYSFITSLQIVNMMALNDHVLHEPLLFLGVSQD